MTLATLDSLKEKGRVDCQDIREKFCNWLHEDAYTAEDETFDVGTTTRMALQSGEGLKDYFSNGNGSLMRILPLAFFDVTDEEIMKVSAIIHGHELSMNACIKYVHLARHLIEGKEIKKESIRKKPIEEIESSGFVGHTLEASIWCLLRTSSYPEVVLTAVKLGGDTDTTAAVTGGLAGIRYGYDAIPKEWIATLKNKDCIDMILNK